MAPFIEQQAMPLSELTNRQQAVLEFIRDWAQRNDATPTRAEIVEAFKFNSPNAAEKHLRALVAAGCIELVPGSWRNIRLLEAAEAMLARQFELPLIGRIAAGSPITASQNVDSWIKIDPDQFRPGADFMHQVDGDSMIDAGILSGDLVAIHAQEVAENGQIIAAAIHDDATGDERITLKRYFRRRDLIQLQSENQARDYPPIEIRLGRRAEHSQDGPVFRIAGLCTGLIRRLR